MKMLVDGQLIEYSDEGKGRTVLLLHGWGANGASFNDVAAELSRKFRVIRLDFPGFGASPKPNDTWGVGEYAVFVESFIKKLGIDKLYAVIGHSFGGRVIIKGISKNNFVPEKVVLIDTAGVKPADSSKRAAFQVIAKLGKGVTAMPGLKSLRPVLRKKLYKAAGSSDYLDAADMKRIFLNTINEDLLGDVSSITQPTLLIWGEKDMETPVADAYKIMNELPDGQLVVVPYAGHFVYLDDQLAVMKELEGFLG